MTIPQSVAEKNVRAFLLFRVFFNARFYYPVLAVLFLDLGLSLEQYALLNVAWAAAIVLVEVPSGALADLIGRKKLVVTASILMVIEMLVFAFAPTSNKEMLFWVFMLNRVLSGVAEACASGADEALVYESLKAENRESEWGSVLERLNKLMAISFFIAMIVGAAVYDPHFFTTIAGFFGWNLQLRSEDVVRFPIYLTLISAVVAYFTTWGMHESPMAGRAEAKLGLAFRRVYESGHWILNSPVALFVMLATLAGDCCLRLFMTFTSKYFRLIHLPEITFGIIGAVIGLTGYLSPAIAKRFVRLGNARRAFAALSLLSFIGLFALPFDLPYIGLLFVLLIGVTMGVLGFLTSYYLNEAADPARRATILSFEGLTSNLAYGGMGIFFAALLRGIQHADPSLSEDSVFNDALKWLPWTFLFLVGVAYLLPRFIGLFKRPAGVSH